MCFVCKTKYCAAVTNFDIMLSHAWMCWDIQELPWSSNYILQLLISICIQELEDIKMSGLKSFRDIQIDEANILIWSGLIVPVSSTFSRTSNDWDVKVMFVFYLCQENAPYNKGAFRIEINFPAEYPFKPPKICFKTKIYHPNIDEKGQVCLPIISAENWKPATKTDQGNSRWTAWLEAMANRKIFKSNSTNSAELADRAGERSGAGASVARRSGRGTAQGSQEVLQERRRFYAKTQREATNRRLETARARDRPREAMQEARDTNMPQRDDTCDGASCTRV